MNGHFRKLCSVLTVAALLSSTAFAAEEEHEHKQPMPSHPSGDTGRHEAGMHMHKSDITHTADAVAEFKGEAAALRAQAESHRKLATLYQDRKPAKSTANFDTVAKHCDQLAKAYDDAAKAADAAAAELAK